VVAIDAYEDSGFAQLRAPSRDAEALAGVLADQHIGGFDVTVLCNETERVISEAVEAFFTDGSRDDLLLMHLGCHGVKDAAGELYFAARDTKLARLRATGLSSSFVRNVMADSRARRSVLLLDCCYSGAFEPGLTHRAGGAVDLEDRFSNVGSGRGRAVITASSAMEYAFEGTVLTDEHSEGPSVFTSAIVEGLRTGEADQDQDGVVHLDELYEYTCEKVRRATSRQTPHMWLYGLEGRLSIARRASPVTTPAPLPHELRAALDNPLAGVRQSVVAELSRLARGAHHGLRLAARAALAELTDDDSKAVETAARQALAELPPEVPAASTSNRRAADAADPSGSPPDVEPELRRVPAADPGGGTARRVHGVGHDNRTAPVAAPTVAGAPSLAAGPPVTSPAPRPVRRRAWGLLLAVATAVLAVALLEAALPPDDDGPSRTDDGLVWTGGSPPTEEQQDVLETVHEWHAHHGDEQCAGSDTIASALQIAPDTPHSVFCRYGEDRSVSFVRFSSDAKMVEHFEDRLRSRDLVRRQGTLGPMPPWQVDIQVGEGLPGRAFGTVNRHRPVNPLRSEIGWYVEGSRTFAYAFRPSADFADFYEWWATAFGASPG
jgi:hypothetical protein